MRRFGSAIPGEVSSYGFNSILKQYSGIPQWLPITANVYHGWYIHNAPRESDLRSPRHTTLVFNSRHKREWESESSKDVHIVGAPFCHFRRMAGIEKRTDAQGTIVFPAHDGTDNDAAFDLHLFCEQLLGLDSKFHPLTISLLEKDIVNGKHRVYEKYGLTTVSAGGKQSARFAHRFYDNLSRHKYSCGNSYGSHLLYSVEMGIPYFFVGEPTRGINRTTGKPTVFQFTQEQRELADSLHRLFARPVESVTAEQNQIIRAESGLDDCLEPEELRGILLRSLFLKDLPNQISRAFGRFGRAA